MTNRRPQKRRVDGILVVNKPAGLTSNAVLQRAKSIYFAAKAGHTGSLDPLATGVLPLCFGEATKLSQFLLEADKEYVTTICLGATTDTADADGRIVAECSAAAVRLEVVKEVMARFTGRIEQVPPMFSALKRGGVPLYELARRGEVVEREARAVLVHELVCLEFTAGERAALKIRVRASKGTYVRTLAEDIGNALGCGGHVAVLHRSASGPFHDAQAVTLERLEQLRDERAFEALDSLLLAPDSAVGHLPELRVADSSCYYLSQGQAVMVAHGPSTGLVRVTGEQGDFRGVGEIVEGRRVAPRRMMMSAPRARN